MIEGNKFEITEIEKETIKMRLLFMVVYFKDRVVVREDYINEIFNSYDEELKEYKVLENYENEIWDKTLLSWNLVEIQYRMLLTFICLICQMFEQFLIDIIIEKLNLKKGLYFNNAKDKFKEYGFNYENLNSWEKIKELRLLVNVIKHADGESKNKLQAIKPSYFYNNANDMIKNTINDMKLNIEAKDFFEYCTAIMEFINDMPSCFEKEKKMELPKTCLVDRFIPKKTFYEKVNISNSIKEEFVEKLSKIYWRYKISEDTINISKTDEIEEIEIFEIELKEKYNSKNLIAIITKNIPYPILFCIKYESEFQYAIRYKGDIFFSEWNKELDFKFTALNISLIYENIVKCITNIDDNVAELNIEIQKQKEIEKINIEMKKLESKMRNEKQFNIKVKYNEQIIKLKKEIEELNSNGK